MAATDSESQPIHAKIGFYFSPGLCVRLGDGSIAVSLAVSSCDLRHELHTHHGLMSYVSGLLQIEDGVTFGHPTTIMRGIGLCVYAMHQLPRFSPNRDRIINAVRAARNLGACVTAIKQN